MKDDQQWSAATPLTFDNDVGSSKAAWMAGALVVGLIGWMGSGLILPYNDKAKSQPESLSRQPVTVATRQSTSQQMTHYFRGEGQAMPDRESTLMAEMSGRIAKVLIHKGATVKAGDVIARFETGQRRSNLNGARVALAQASRAFDNAETLFQRGATTKDRLSAARAELASAKAQFSTAEFEFSATDLSAPFDGRIEALIINEGEYVQADIAIGKIVDTSPLTVSVQVPQQARGALRIGMPTTVSFLTGEVREGEIAFLGLNASNQTRTFLMEISINNIDGEIPAGVSAEVQVSVGTTNAHFLTPAVLSLGVDGQIGVKTVNSDDKIVFHPVDIIRAQTNGVWVSGLPQIARIVTIGQGFVNEGEIVAPMDDARPDPDQTQNTKPVQ